MAEKTLHLDVVTPEKTIVSDEVDIVMAPGYFVNSAPCPITFLSLPNFNPER